jgi:outer membrane protein assembly factor BamB
MNKVLLPKATLIVLFVFVFVFPGRSQSLVVKTKEIPVGFSHVANDSIDATEFQFDRAITQYQLDTARNTFTLRLRDVHKSGRIFLSTGAIAFFDLSGERLKWAKEIDYKETDIQQFPYYLLESNPSKSYSLDFNTGARVWQASVDIYHIQKEKNLGIGYPFVKPSQVPSNVLKAIDLTTGEEKWSRIIHREYGWNEVFELNDSTLAIVASGIQAVNIHNGSGWAYYTATGAERLDAGTTAAFGALGVGLGLLTGYYMYGVSTNVYAGVVSNVLTDGGRLYMTSYEEVVCLDAATGKVIWKNPLYKSKVSSGFIFIESGKLYQINLGKVGAGGEQYEMGDPYVATYDLESGNLVDFFELPITDFVIDHRIHKDHFDLLHSRGLIRLDKKDLSVVSQIAVSRQDKVTSFLKNDFFHHAEDQYQSLKSLYPAGYFLQTSDVNLLVIDQDLQFAAKFRLSDLYKEHFDYRGHKILVKGAEISVVDSNLTEVATIKNNGELVLASNFLLLIYDNKLQKLDLDKLFGSDFF